MEIKKKLLYDISESDAELRREKLVAPSIGRLAFVYVIIVCDGVLLLIEEEQAKTSADLQTPVGPENERISSRQAQGNSISVVDIFICRDIIIGDHGCDSDVLTDHRTTVEPIPELRLESEEFRSEGRFIRRTERKNIAEGRKVDTRMLSHDHLTTQVRSKSRPHQSICLHSHLLRMHLLPSSRKEEQNHGAHCHQAFICFVLFHQKVIRIVLITRLLHSLTISL